MSNDDQQRFKSLIELIEGQNSLQVRQTGASELLRQGWAQTAKRIVAILAGADAAAKTAVANALAGTPQSLDAQYVTPLMTMLGDADGGVRKAAAGALAAYREGGVVAGLKTLVLEVQQPLQARLGAVSALGLMTDRDAVAVLIECLGDSNAELRNKALAALESATGQTFVDVATATLWWSNTRDLPVADWRQHQIERLVGRNRELMQQLGQVKAQLVKSLRECYVRTPQAERGALLLGYLSDAEPSVRTMGLELVRSELTERTAVTDEVMAAVRGLTENPEVRVRIAALRVVAGLRDTGDCDRFIRMLDTEKDGDVRIAIINGLGYVGTVAAVEPLLRLLADANEAVAAEAAGAMGRLAERNVIDASQRTAVADALIARFNEASRDQGTLRERVLWAMARVGDARFGGIYVRALDAAEPAGIRQAAALGIDALKDGRLADSLLRGVGDADVGLRKTCVEVLGRIGGNDTHLEALWGRLSESQESNPQVRDAAWQGAVRILGSRAADDIAKWANRLPDEGETKLRRGIELWQLAEKSLAANPGARAELGKVRSELAGRLVAANRADEAVAMYLKAIDDLHAAASPDTLRVAIELVRVALTTDRYDEKVAAALAAQNPGLDGAKLWDGVCADMEKCVAMESAEHAISALSAFQAHPPTTMPAEASQAISGMLARARAMRGHSGATGPGGDAGVQK